MMMTERKLAPRWSGRGAFALLSVAAATACASAGSRTDDAGAPASVAPVVTASAGAVAVPASSARCDPTNGGITLPAGFCAAVFAESLGQARHMTVAPNGDVFVIRRGPRTANGGVIALRDADGDGRAEARESFGPVGGTGIALDGGMLYVDARTQILRYRIPAGSLRPAEGTAPDTIVDSLPTGGHGAGSLALGPGNVLYINSGSRTNSCQQQDRGTRSPGIDPCVELELRAGVWRYRADALRQKFSAAERFATGIRNAVALRVRAADGALYVMQHGRDQLFQNWPALYDSVQSAEKPAEVLLRVDAGDDFGWPYCYYDGERRSHVLAPEYGGNARDAGRCARIEAPVAAFPAHWAPNDLIFYGGTQFPARYRGGAFIAFHGSWNRAPLPQAGFNVVFQPLGAGGASGAYEVFADGFSRASAQAQGRSGASHRPTGLAQMPDGSLLISDDVGGRIWRIYYIGS